jgi:hypothetical protein
MWVHVDCGIPILEVGKRLNVLQDCYREVVGPYTCQ